MDFNLSEEQVMLRDGARRFVEDSYDVEKHRHLSQSATGFSADHWGQFAELGWLSLALPEEIVGFEFSFEEIALVMEEFGRGLVLEPYLTTAVLGANILVRSNGDAEFRTALLNAIAAGEKKLTLAYSENSAIFNAGETLSTQAESSGSGFVLSGAKTLVFDAPSADALIVTAQLDGQPALLFVDAATAGVTIEGYPLNDGTRAADVRFDNVKLPASALLARGNEAVSILDESLDRATLARIAEAVGAMEACLEITSAYIKERQQFGQPIGRFQALQHIMAEMFVETQEARSMLYHGIAHIEDANADVRKRAISLAKVAAGRAGHFVSASGIQLHGGYGVTDEYIISRYFRRLMSIEKAFGDSGDHRRRYEQLSDTLEK